MIKNLFESAVTSTQYSTHYEIPHNHRIESVQLVIGNTATGKFQVTNDPNHTNWVDLTAGSSATAGYKVGSYYRFIRAAVTAYTTGDVDAYVGLKTQS